MKKLMFAALLVMGSSVAYAGPSEALKAIKKAKNYTEAEALVKSTLDQLATPAEKAEAYNHLVDLAMEKFTAEQATIAANQAAEQLKKTDDIHPYDTVGFAEACYNMVIAGMECEKYDQMPDVKGRIKPKFHDNNVQRVYNARLQLVNVGQTAAQHSDAARVLKFWGAFLDTKDSPLFEKAQKVNEADFLGQVAYFTARYAGMEKKDDLALKYVEIAIADPQQQAEALEFKFSLMQKNLKTKADTLAYVKELKDFYAKDPKSEAAFGTLVNMYSSMKMTAEMNQLIQEKIAADPNNTTAWALKGQSEMNNGEYDEAINSFKKYCEQDDTNPIVLTYLGFCINSKSAGIENNRKLQKELYTESMHYLERAKELDPDREKSNWAYPLYQCYYLVYSANDPRTKEMEALLKK